jgi:hypothetical protein
MKINSQYGWAPALVTLLALGGMAGGMAACGPHHERVVATRTVVEEHTTAAPKMVDISIVNLHDEPAADPAQERVVGTIVNAGDRSVRGLSIRVEALDRSGNVVTSIVTPPLAHEIDAFGGRTDFEALMPHDPTVTGYHAVAIAR